jgi:hypothetical protein
MSVSILKSNLLNWITHLDYPSDASLPEEACVAILENPKYREYCTKWMLGLNESSSVNGYDDDQFPIEVKTQHATGKSVLTGSGKYSDLTKAMHEKYLSDNPAIYLAGFAYTKMLYIVHVPYTSIAVHIEKQLQASRSRTPSFTFSVWGKAKHKIVYTSPFIAKYRDCISTSLYTHLTNT